jgi:membrane fusion protein (multidrug efflux system)
VVAAVCLATVGACLLVFAWGRYRYEHVVLSEASVKGVVSKIGARMDGRVSHIHVEVGQAVARNQVLLQLDDSHLRAAADRELAEWQRLSKELECEKLSIEQDRRELSAASERYLGVRKAAVGEWEARRSHAAAVEKQFQRTAELVKTGIAAPSEMDAVTGERERTQGLTRSAQGAVEAAESGYQEAMAELEGLKVREARLGVLEAQVQAAAARLAEARANLEATVIRAPEAGRVLERIVEVGGSAKVGEPLLALWLGRAWVEGWVEEKHLGKFQVGHRAEVALAAWPEKKLAGRVESIGFVTDKQLQPAPVPATLHALVRRPAMVPVRIALEEEEDRVRLGLSAVVGIRKQGDSAMAGRPGLAARGLPDASAAAGHKDFSVR